MLVGRFNGDTEIASLAPQETNIRFECIIERAAVAVDISLGIVEEL